MSTTDPTQRIENGPSSLGADGGVFLRGVEKQFPGHPTVLSGIDLTVGRGQFVSILGPSGSGKSTLLRMLANLVSVTRGEIQIEGETPADFLSQTAFVFQDPTLLPWKRVLENVELPLKIAGIPVEERRQKARHWLRELGLGDAEGKFPRQLSGGMKMRVSLARMLVRQPRLMLFDEPFAALDEFNRYRLNEMLSELYHRERWTAFFVTHSVTEALFLADRVIVLGGKPATIVGDFQLPWEFPRRGALRKDPAYHQMIETVTATLNHEGGP